MNLNYFKPPTGKTITIMARNRGIQEDKGAGRTYVALSKGSFVNRVPEPTKTSKPRTLGEKSPNAGAEIHEERFESFVGLIQNIELEEHDQYGTSWKFTIDVTPGPEEPEELFVLKLDYDSGYAADILKRLPNMDVTDDVIFKAYSFKPKDKDKVKVGISIFQYDQNDKPVKILPYYTKDNPNGLPKMIQVDDPKKKGKKIWTSVEMFDFLEKMVFADIVPKLNNGSFSESPSVNNQMQPSEEFNEENEGGDIPF